MLTSSHCEEGKEKKNTSGLNGVTELHSKINVHISGITTTDLKLLSHPLLVLKASKAGLATSEARRWSSLCCGAGQSSSLKNQVLGLGGTCGRKDGQGDHTTALPARCHSTAIQTKLLIIGKVRKEGVLYTFVLKKSQEIPSNLYS